MSLSVKDSSQFKINEVSIVTKLGLFDITSVFIELNLFDSIFMPVMSGNILITDSVGMSSRFLFDGSETILIDIGKDGNSDIARIKKAYRIYKQSNRKNANQNSESYILHFVSDELMYSDQQKINQSYEASYSTIVEKILLDYLKVPKNQLNGIYEKTSGIRKVIIPNLRPLDAIEWCAKRAIDNQNSPNYVFFNNLIGYNFVSLSTLLTKEQIMDIKFEPQNLTQRNAIQQLNNARSFEVVMQNDSIDKTRSGVNAGKFIGFDPITKMFATRNISYADHYSSMKHGNEKPNYSAIRNRDNKFNDVSFDARKVLSSFGTARKYSEYIKKNDGASISKDESYENFLFQRKAIFKNLTNKRLKLVMPGNFQLSSGFNVNFSAPTYAIKEKGDSNEDITLSGKYIIVAARHTISYNKHETIIEVASSSTNNPYINASIPEQNDKLLNYT